MRFEIRSSKPIATELVTAPTLEIAIDHAVSRVEDGFAVTLTDCETGDLYMQTQILEAVVGRSSGALHYTLKPL